MSRIKIISFGAILLDDLLYFLSINRVEINVFIKKNKAEELVYAPPS